MANPKLRLPGQRGRRRRSGDREEGFPSLVRPGLPRGSRGRYDDRGGGEGWRYRDSAEW